MAAPETRRTPDPCGRGSRSPAPRRREPDRRRSPSTIAHASPGVHRTHIPLAPAHAINSFGRPGPAKVTVSCASPARDGPRSVELASSDATGPVITAELVGAQPALKSEATTSTAAAMSAGRRRRTSVMLLGAVGDVPTMLAGLGLRWRRRDDGRRELVRRLRVDARSLLGRRDRSGRRRGRRRGRGRRGFWSLFLFLGSSRRRSCPSRRLLRARQLPRGEEANDFVSSLLVLSVYLHRITAGVTAHGATVSECAPAPQQNLTAAHAALDPGADRYKRDGCADPH